MCACVHGLSLACLVLFSFASSSSSSLFTFEYLFMCCVRQSMSACLLSISFRFRSNRIRLIEFLCLRFSAFYITSISYHFYFLLATQNYKKKHNQRVMNLFPLTMAQTQTSWEYLNKKLQPYNNKFYRY